MKSKEEIEQLAELWNDQQTELEFGKPHNAPNRVKSFIQGYTKCQEETATILFNISKLINESPYTEHSRLTDIKDYIKSLNKQD